jgi:predicted ATPase/DNA-binding SARP family transcriptional activator
MSRLALYLLGPPRVERDGAPVKIYRRKAVALLAYLAVTRRTHSRDALATLLWPESDQGSARAGLRNALAALRKGLGEGSLDVDREHVALVPAASPHGELVEPSGQGLWLDVDAFRERLAACRTHGHPPEEVCPACLSTLTEAAALYRDDFLAGFTLPDSPAFDEWQFFQAEGLRDALASALERLARGHGDRGAYETAIAYTRRWVALDALHEPAHRLLMGLYARAGQRAAALRQYEECARVLNEELGAPPEEETTQLYREIQARRAPSRPADLVTPSVPSPTPPHERPERRRHNLPAQATPFIGRQAQLAEVRALLSRPEVRLLTLTGPGGTGKTRLALQVAAEVLDAYPDGVFFVALAPIRDPALVIPTIATTIGVRESGGRPIAESLKYALQDRQVLLVVDNFEQVAAAAPHVADLLAAAAQLRVLVTSRTLLHVYGEYEYRVPPMVTPGPEDLPPTERLAQVEAVQLFVQRAQAARADFALDEGNAQAIAEICARLDGLPLAIELAAARVRLLSPEAMLPHLDDRLGFLTGGPRDLPARQRTLRATIEWSYDLLDADECALFHRLAVYAGGCTLETVEAVCTAPPSSVPRPPSLDLLASLVDQNLLQVSEVNGQPRFEMLETVREYAAERLAGSGEGEAVRRRHARAYLALAQEAEGELHGPEQVAWLDRLEGEHDNLRAALAWSMEDDVEVGLRLAGALGDFWDRLAYFREGRDWLAKAVTKAADYGPDLNPLRAKALYQAGVLAKSVNDRTTAFLLLRESEDLYRALDDGRGLAYVLHGLAMAGWSMVAFTRVRSFLEESIALFRQWGDRRGLAQALCTHGDDVGQYGRDYESARASLTESMNLGQETGDLGVVARATRCLGTDTFVQGDYATAQALYEKSLALSRVSKDTYAVGQVLAKLGDVAYVQGHYERARAHYQQAIEMWQQAGDSFMVPFGWRTLGLVSLRQGHLEEARTYLTKALVRLQEIGESLFIANVTVAWAGLAGSCGQPERAARLLGIVEAIIEARGIPVGAFGQVEYERNVATVRAQLDEATFARA